MSEDNQFRSTYTFWLPPELWMRVAYFLPRMPDQPRWQPWVKYRGLNRIFKKEIEDFYFKHWIKRSKLWVKRTDEYPLDVPFYLPHELPDLPPEFYPTYLHECYTFSGFRDSEKRIAIFEGQILKWTDPRDREKLILIEKMLNEFDEQGYNPYITFEIEKGVTDLLPIDLRLRHTVISSYFTFDWRTYLSTLLDERRRVDEYEERTGCKSPLQLAVKLGWKVDSREMEPMEAMLHLARAAGTDLVGRDGRLLEIRRRRRFCLGLKTGKLRRRHRLPHPLTVVEHRFAQLDEEHVAETLLGAAMDSGRSFPAQIEW
ncbi:hypothetical protein Asppvi_005759 [Aspergillus pseudoviridinutans]|uniref:Uncharacterized protein n=1 Tax=Aspergillus pseudoviridinutans TaxID=1517512 RepID=A0A9P3ESV5_9EURO|nr:uncharacterized protein Asppvi_005759 [Aspergillus pseudoviridinutans]GIJ86861.1 hypothetical protein Asppvi_005759 [Aspergillus pseudoviridinutans]